MNQFEETIMKAACDAQNFHRKMTGGYNLSYSHESFLQNFIAFQLLKLGYWVNIDPSLVKVREEVQPRGRIPNPKRRRKRYDLIVWRKIFRSANVKAIIEIKKAWSKRPVLDDVGKVTKFLQSASGQGANGYVLYYTDKRRSEKRTRNEDHRTISGRFDKVHNSMRQYSRKTSFYRGIKHDSTRYVYSDLDEDPWGFALFRC